MKRLIVIVLVLFTISAGGYFYISHLLAPRDVPPAVLEAENAIALASTIAISSIDMEYVKRIDLEINGKDDPSPLLAAAVSDTLLGSLQKQGINPIKQTDYVISTIGVSKDKASFALVLLGNYSVDAIKQAIRNQYIVNADSPGYWLVQAEDVKTCKLSSAKAVSIQDSRILIASAEFMPTLIERLQNKMMAGVDLTKWRKFRRDKVFAGAILNPKDTSKGAQDFITRGLLKKGIDEQPLESIYTGVVVNILPPQGLKLVLDAWSTESTWAQETENQYNKWVTKSEHELKVLPTVARLMRHMSVRADGNVLHAQVIADSDLVDDLKEVPSELISLVFSGVKTSDSGASQASEEKIISLDEIVKLKPQMSFEDIESFDAQNANIQPDAISGPFSINVGEIGLLATRDDIVQFTLKVEGEGLGNMTLESTHTSAFSNPAVFTIVDVKDSQGRNLLREERCGKELNLDKEILSISPKQIYQDGKWVIASMQARGEKKFRLREGISFDKVDSITGLISLELATKTITQTINAPFSDKVIESDKVRIFFKDGGSSRIRYDISGELHHILAVRPKNADGQYLADNDSTSVGGINNRKSVTRKVKGEVKSIEVVYAQQVQSKEFSFEIDGLAPKFKAKNTWEEGEPHIVTAATKKIFELSARDYNYPVKNNMGLTDKNSVEVGPFMIHVDEIKDRWGQQFGGYFTIYGPDFPTLHGNMSAVEIIADEIITSDNEAKEFDVSEIVVLERRGVGNTNNLQYYLGHQPTGLHASYEDNPSLKNITVRKVKGRLKIKLPKKLYQITLDGRTLGGKMKTKNGLVAKLVGFKHEQIILEFQGPVETIVQILPKDSKGEVLYASAKLVEKQINTWQLSKEEKAALESQPKTWEAHVSMFEQPSTIDILYANDFDVIEYPFEVEGPNAGDSS